jgi:hypothetical protein
MKFFSCVKGKLVSRLGTGTFIGARRDPENPKVVHFFPERVVAIPDVEYFRNLRTYRKAIQNEELKVRTEAEWDAQQKAEDEAVKKAHEELKAKKAAKKAEAEKNSNEDSNEGSNEDSNEGSNESEDNSADIAADETTTDPPSKGETTGGSRSTKGRRRRRS